MEALGLPTPPRTPGVDEATSGRGGAGIDAELAGSPSMSSFASVVGFGVAEKTTPTSPPVSTSARAAARRKRAASGDSPLAALLRSHASYPCLPVIKTGAGIATPLSCRTVTPPPGPISLNGATTTTPLSTVETSPYAASSNLSLRTRSYSDLMSGCSTPLSRSSDPISIPPARMASLLGHEAALMEELSSAESHGASRWNSNKRTSTTATAGTGTTTGTATASSTAFPGSSLSGSLRDIQTLMDKQGQAGAARLLAELAAAQAERDALASDAAVLKAAAEWAERGAAEKASRRRQEESCCCSGGNGGLPAAASCGCSCSQRLQQQQENQQRQQPERGRPLEAPTPPPTFLFDDLDLGPPAAAASVVAAGDAPASGSDETA